MILSGLIVSTLLWANLHDERLRLGFAVLAVTLGFGLVGISTTTISRSRSRPTMDSSGRTRLLIETLIAGMARIAIAGAQASREAVPIGTTIVHFPVLQGHVPRASAGCSFPFGAFIIVGAANAVDLTDEALMVLPSAQWR